MCKTNFSPGSLICVKLYNFSPGSLIRVKLFNFSPGSLICVKLYNFSPGSFEEQSCTQKLSARSNTYKSSKNTR